ncbi:MAG: DUF3488 and transglutaminase-like domain-containing protein [Thermodesulfovibrionales bacterium]|jgi:transglutaminase-like putative cysteine protease
MTKRESLRIEDVIKLMTYAIGSVGFLAIVRYIGIAYSILFVLLCLLSLFLDFRGGRRIPRWGLNITAVTVILLSLSRITIADPVTPTVEGLVMLLAIKFVEEKQFRDYMQIYGISLLLLAGSSLFSIDISFSLFFLVLIFLLALSIVFLAYYSQDPEMVLKKKTIITIGSSSLIIPLLAIPTTLFLFVILPRTNYPLFDFLNRAEQAKTGFSESVRLGDVSGIQEDTTTIFRAQMAEIDGGALYWRGIVMDYCDGVSWRRSGEVSARSFPSLRGRQIRQSIYLDPYGNRYLFGLDRPQSMGMRGVIASPDLTFSLPRPPDRRIRYDTASIVSPRSVEILENEAPYLQLPEVSPEIRKLVRSLTEGKDARAATQAVHHYFTGGGYSYSLRDLPLSRRPLDDFLFRYKYGNCEYFASSMAFMLRVAAIPSRLVGGYRGGYYNEMGGYYIVPQRNAHVWVEAYLDGAWERWDPTPASPDRFLRSERGLLFRLRLMMDTINYSWNAFIISYDLDKQVSLFKGMQGLRLGLSLKKGDVVRYLFTVFLFAVTAFLVYALLTRKRPEERLLSLFLKRMAKLGYERLPSQGLEEFVSAVPDAQVRERAERFVEDLQRISYRDRAFTREDIRRLKGTLRSL